MAHSLGNVRFGTLHGWTLVGEKSNHNRKFLSLYYAVVRVIQVKVFQLPDTKFKQPFNTVVLPFISKSG